MEYKFKCENCNKEFLRREYSISKHNYCSRSCAAIINNKKFPKRSAPKVYCKFCKKEFKRNFDSIFCSVKCRILAQKKYNPEAIIEKIAGLAKIDGHTPSRRELGNLSYAAIRIFGSWNKTIEVAGLKPNRSHDNRMYKRILATAEDGHKCDSVSELLIDNWLSKNKIEHVRNTRYPNSNHLADWTIGDKIFVEYFGLAKDSPRYDREIKIKQELCKKFKITLIEIYPSDLYPQINLNKKFELLFVDQNLKSSF